MNSETKITMANIRVALSHQYSTFEISAQLENEKGITSIEVNEARVKIQALAMDAVNEYKSLPSMNPKEEIKRVEQRIGQIKKMVEENQKAEPKPDPIAEAEIAALPPYVPPVKKETPAKATKKTSPKKK